MRLKTIWTMRGMAFRERVRRTDESFMRWLAHRLPRKLAYWSFIDTGVRTIEGDEVVPEIPYIVLLDRTRGWAGRWTF